jgi:uncharacterized membrane protein YcaP (DUF421 family)
MDLVIRATIVFFFILVVTRVVGRREIGELEPFDFILLIVMGDLVQQGITQSDNSVTGTLIVISTIALLSMLVSWLSFRIGAVRHYSQGDPIVLVRDGKPIARNMRRERITMDDLYEEMRQSQLMSLDDLRWAILEDDGKISCIPRKED